MAGDGHTKTGEEGQVATASRKEFDFFTAVEVSPWNTGPGEPGHVPSENERLLSSRKMPPTLINNLGLTMAERS